jgi:hypothetical protein
MRNMLRFSAVLAFVLAAATAGFCQSSGDSGQTGGQPHGQWQGDHHGPRGRFRNPEFETRMLTKRLNLSTEQASAIEPILAQQDAALKALRPAAGTQPDFKAMQAARKSIMESTVQQINPLLSSEQQAEFAKMHEHHGPHGDWKGKSAGAPGV